MYKKNLIRRNIAYEKFYGGSATMISDVEISTYPHGHSGQREVQSFVTLAVKSVATDFFPFVVSQSEE